MIGYLHTCDCFESFASMTDHFDVPRYEPGVNPPANCPWPRFLGPVADCRRSDPMSGTHGAATAATTNYRTLGGAAMAVHGWSRHHRKTSRSRVSTGEGLMRAYVHHMHNTIINRKQSS